MQNFKQFESEEEIIEKRRKRQEEWEKVRKPDQPIQAPEEEVDNRSLYDRLQEQKNKKQAEHDDKHRLSNQVRGLDSEEADFLDFVSQRQQEIEDERLKEEEEVIALLRQSNPVTSSSTASGSTSSSTTSKQLPKPPSYVEPKKLTQAEILGRLIKRKRKSSGDDAPGAKKAKGSSDEKDEDAEDLQSATYDDVEGTSSDDSGANGTAVGNGKVSDKAQVIGILPGIGIYADSSDSDSSDSSDSDIDTDVFRRSSKEVEKIIQAAAAASHQH